MNNCRLTENADLDIIEIYLYSLKTFGIAQTENYIEALHRCLASLAENPFLGRDCSMIKPGVRRFEYAKHSIYYRTDEYDILVLRILHQRMDPARYL